MDDLLVLASLVPTQMTNNELNIFKYILIILPMK